MSCRPASMRCSAPTTTARSSSPHDHVSDRSGRMSTVASVPTAIHRPDDALPFAPIAPGVESKVSQVNISDGLWVVRSRMQPGYLAQTHRHTGPVYGFTLSGAWHYLESADEVNRAGSYLFEPAGSVHTLHVPD